MEFNQLSTVTFMYRMRPAALAIYQKIFPGCTIQDLREKEGIVHILDKEFGIDCLAYINEGQWISIQEKYRKNSALKYMDFTQEYKNAAGTIHENDGEWFKLGAQVYFYGWANAQETDFEKWFLMDIAKYKIVVNDFGGITKIGKLKRNSLHGSATFYSIPLKLLEPCFITDYRNYK